MILIKYMLKALAGHSRGFTNTLILQSSMNEKLELGCRYSWSDSLESFPEFPWIIHVTEDHVSHTSCLAWPQQLTYLHMGT